MILKQLRAIAASADRTDLQPGMSGRIFLVEEVR